MWLSVQLAHPLHRCLTATAFWAPQLHRQTEKKCLENSVKANITAALCYLLVKSSTISDIKQCLKS